MTATLSVESFTVAKLREGRDGELYRLVGAEIRRRRERMGKTQDELAIRVGLSRASVANLEAGRQAVPLHHLVEVAAALGVSAADLLPKEPVLRDSGAKALDGLPSTVRAFAERALRARS